MTEEAPTPKRYAVFAYDDYYPSGGMNDFCGTYDTVEEASDCGQSTGWDNWEVVDLRTLTVVASRPFRPRPHI